METARYEELALSQLDIPTTTPALYNFRCDKKLHCVLNCLHHMQNNFVVLLIVVSTNNIILLKEFTRRSYRLLHLSANREAVVKPGLFTRIYKPEFSKQQQNTVTLKYYNFSTIL